MEQEKLLGEKIEQLEKEILRVKNLYQKCLRYQEADPEVALSQARKSAEAICKHIYVNGGLEKGGKPSSKMMLNDLIGALSRKRIVPQHIIIALGTIQHYGNFGTHDQGEDSEYITKEFVETCLSALSTAVNWYFQEYSNLPLQKKESDTSPKNADKKDTSNVKKNDPAPQAATGMDEILGRYSKQFQDDTQKTGKIRGFFKEVVSDKVGGVYRIYFDDAPEKRLKELMTLHQIDLREKVHVIIDNDRIGDDDSSTLITDHWISISSNAGLVYGGDFMALKLSLARCSKIERRFDTVYLYAGEEMDFEEFHFPLTVLIDNEAAINKNKVDPLISLLNDIFSFHTNSESQIIREILSIDDEKLPERVAEYRNRFSLQNYRIFCHLAKYHCGNGNLKEGNRALKSAKGCFEKQYGNLEKLEKNPLEEKILKEKEQLQDIERFINEKTDPSSMLSKNAG
jgi:hypothetical protein